ICNYAGVVIFTGLTAYDTQKIKNMLVQVGDADSETGLRISLLGSLTLYLDFINLFLYLLRFLGRRR
ncbi:Bax inhibitor-1 family protein, partial [Enterobacter asburiae]|uniref:Bax inhibitor-1 family protein n=1 Tax=Enterobacter asburiae TaxID=61645 RepID=UPI00402ABA4E